MSLKTVRLRVIPLARTTAKKQLMVEARDDLLRVDEISQAVLYLGKLLWAQAQQLSP